MHVTRHLRGLRLARHDLVPDCRHAVRETVCESLHSVSQLVELNGELLIAFCNLWNGSDLGLAIIRDGMQ